MNQLTPLQHGVADNDVGLVRALTSNARVDVNAGSSHVPETPLYWACQQEQGELSVVQLLLAVPGISVNAGYVSVDGAYDVGETPLHAAVSEVQRTPSPTLFKMVPTFLI